MKTIRKMFEHIHWANQRILGGIQHAEEESQEIERLFSHILQTEQVWFTRLQGLDSSTISIWPEMTLKECSELIQQNQTNFNLLLNQLSEADLDQVIEYKNSKGQVFKNTTREILTHIALHGQYHRGQINSRLRLGGMEPVNTDFITFVR